MRSRELIEQDLFAIYGEEIRHALAREENTIAKTDRE